MAEGGSIAHRHTDTKTKRMTCVIRSALWSCGEGELATTLPMVAPLNAFPFCSPQGPLQDHCAKSGTPPTLFFTPLSASKLATRYKNKRYRFLDTFLLRSLAEREGFEPPEPRSSTVFKTAAIDHSATSPKDKSIAFFLNHQIFFKLFLKKNTPATQHPIDQQLTDYAIFSLFFSILVESYDLVCFSKKIAEVAQTKYLSNLCYKTDIKAYFVGIDAALTLKKFIDELASSRR